MKPRNKAVNILTAVVAVLLSILLIPLLFATGLVGAAQRATTPTAMTQFITDAVQNVDFEQIIIDSAGENDVSEEELEQVQIVDRLVESAAAQKIFALYAQDMSGMMKGEYDPANPAVSSEALTSIATEHIDEIVDILGDLNPDADREILRNEVLTYVEDNASDLVGNIPISEIITPAAMPDISQLLQVVKIALWILLGVCVTLGRLIYSCRQYRFGGFIWLGVDAALAGLLTIEGARLLQDPSTLSLIPLEETYVDLIQVLLNGAAGMLNTVALILFGLAVVFVGLYITLKYTVLKKRDAAAQAPGVEIPAEEAVAMAEPHTEEEAP